MKRHPSNRTIAAALLGGAALLFLLILSIDAVAQEPEAASPAVEAETSAGDTEARKQKILANLKLRFDQLRERDVSIAGLEPSGIPGLDQGVLIAGERQQQLFLVTPDDSKLYFVAGPPIDVSRSVDEVQAELDKKEEEAAMQAVERRRQLEESISERPQRGNPEAPVTIVEFSDFQCPYCARGATTIEQVLEKYPEDVKFSYLHFPLDFHPWAKPSAIAAHCAAQQDEGAFWKLHDAYFEDQGEFNPDNVIDKTRELLSGTDVDLEEWAVCAADTTSEAYKAAEQLVEADMELGKELGVSGTPGFFVNGRFLNGAQPLNAFESAISEAKEDPKL